MSVIEPAMMIDQPIDSGARTPESLAAFSALMASGLVWGLIWWPLKYFSEHGLTGLSISLTAYTFLGVAALPLIWRERRRWRAEWRLLLAIGALFGVANLAFTSALMMGSVVRAMLLFYLLPAWGAIGGRLFLNERFGLRRLVAVGLSLAGVAVILGADALLQGGFSAADGVALLAGFCYTGAGIANRRARGIPLASRTLAPFAGCALLGWALVALPMMVAALPAVLLPTQAALSASAPSLALASPAIAGMAGVDLATWGWLALFSVAWLIGASVLTTYGVTHVAASRAAVLQVVELLVAIVSAVLRQIAPSIKSLSAS